MQGGNRRRGEVGQKGAVLAEHAGHVSQQEQPRCAKGSGERTGHGVGVDVIGLAVRAGGNRGDHRYHARCDNRFDHAGIDQVRLADEAEIDHLFDLAAGIAGGPGDLLRRDQTAVLAGNPDSLAARASDPADQLLVDRPGKHHFGNLRRDLVGHPQAIDEA